MRGILKIVSCISAAGFFGASTATAADLQVISTSPSGRTESRTAVSAITATFNQPMVAMDAPGAMGDFCPIRIDPPIHGRCRWQGTQVLSFEPSESLKIATAYTVRIPAGTTSKVGDTALAREVSWAFETMRPQIVTSKPTDSDQWIDLRPTLYVHFNLPMTPARAAKFIALEEEPAGGGDQKQENISVGVRRAKSDEIAKVWPYAYGMILPSTGNVLALYPSRRLKPGHRYALRLGQDLPAEEGTLGLLSERIVHFETWQPFQAVEFPQKECLPANFRIAFTNPINYQDLLDHMTVQPSTAMPKLNPGFSTMTGYPDPQRKRVYFPMPDLGYAPDSISAFKVDKDLKDIFGNRLGNDLTFNLVTDGYCPSINVPTGFGVLEGYLPPRHPVTLLNVSQAPMEMRRIADDEFIPFYKSIQWYANEPQSLNEPLRTTWQSRAKRNTRSRGYLDLNEALNGEGGLVFSQVESPLGRPHWFKALDDVTRLGLTFKNSPDSSLLWVSFLKTGAPAAGQPVEIRDDENQILWQGRTDAHGFAVAPGWKKLALKDWPRYQRPKLWAFAKSANGSAVLSTDMREGVEPWRFGIPYDWYARRERYNASLFTERGVYRPGETVHVKGIIRKLEYGDWAPCDVSKLQVVVKNARQAEVQRTTVTLSGQSSFDLSFALKEEAPTGLWTLEVTEPTKVHNDTIHPVQSEEEDGETRSYVGEEHRIQFSQTFRVEAFKPASFELHVTPDKPSYLSGETYNAVLDGWYLFGAPMTQSNVEWKLRLEPGSYAPPGWDSFDFSGGWWNQAANNASQLLTSGSGDLDSRGKRQVSAKLEPSAQRGPLSAILEASVTSPDRQRLFGRATATVHKANLYLGLKPGQYFATQGKEWSCELAVVRPDGQAAPGMPVTGQLVRRDYLSVERAGLAGRLEWVSEERETVVSTMTAVSNASTMTWTFHLDQPGQYFLNVAGTDESGRQALSSVSFYAMGTGEAWWSRNDTDLVELVADKKEYKPGDTARILVKSPYSKTRVLVTLEREGVINHWLTTLQGGSNFITVPIQDAHVPNVFVGVMLVQGRTGLDKFSETGDDLAKPQAKFGYVNLSVNPKGRRLNVQVATDKLNYRPRELVTVTLRTRDDAGKGAPSEITVFAVDEGVLALTGYATPDAFDLFYGERPLLVDTADSRVHIIGQRSFGEKGESRGGGGGKGANLEGIDLRSRFVPTAYWNPSVATDAFGNARVSFRLPDNLSRFRVMAVAAAGKHFGSGQSKLTVSKPILLRPSLPRFARIGDRFEGGLVLHNYTAGTIQGTLEMRLSGSAIMAEGEPRRTISVEAGKAVEVVWPCRAVSLGKATFQFRAEGGGQTDGLEWTVPVLPAERLETVATSGVTETQTMEAVHQPEGARDTMGGLKISLSPSALSGLQEGARFLLEYPYGCLEQRLSRSLPVIVGADMTAAFHLGTLGTLREEVQKVLNRLPDYQHPNGGFGYWPNPWMPDPWLTSYALEVAALAGKEHYRLPEPVIARAVEWLKTYLSSRQQWAYPYSENEDYCARAYALYVLGLHHQAPSNYFMQLYQRRDQIPYCGKAYLLKAAPLVMNDPAIEKTLSAELLNQARVAPTTLHFEEPVETRMPWVHESTVQTTGHILQALLEAQGGFPGDEKAVHWLIQERKDQGRWRTTQENATSLRALQDYYRRYEKTEPHFTATVTSLAKGEPQTLWTQTFSSRTLQSPLRDFSLGAVLRGQSEAQVRFSKIGEGRLYYTMRLRYAPGKFDKPDSEGFVITKAIKPLYGKGGELIAGARALVTLTIKTDQDRTFVAVNDPLPGGFEIVDPTFETESAEEARPVRQAAASAPYWGGFQRNENYDDRIQIFADFLSAGVHTYSYLVQATTPGQFRSPATFVEAMYEPEIFGRTASTSTEIKR